MPRLPKVHLNNTVVFVTTSLEEGILLTANPLMQLIVLAAIGRAYRAHKVEICHFIVEGSHVHFLFVVHDPADIKGFMERFKTESAHYINKLLGRKKRTVWCEGYDSPMILTVSKVIQKIVYIYENPAKDNLEDSIYNYPGLSSWKAFLKGKPLGISCPIISRDMLSKLPSDKLSYAQLKSFANNLNNQAKDSELVVCNPNGWMRCFGISDEKEVNICNEDIKYKLKEKEKEYRAERVKKGSSVMGANKLRSQNLDITYIPNRSGKKMWVLCDDIQLRKWVIYLIKQLVKKAKEIYEKWKIGDFSEPYPLGLYPPGMPKLAEPIALFD